MKAQAVDQARSRLDKAYALLEIMKGESDAQKIQLMWTDFLLAVGAIYSKLEQGSKGNSRSEAWFGHKKGERKKDPLLSYLHHARNSDEHGIEPVTERHSSYIRMPPRGSVTLQSDGKNTWTVIESSGAIEYANDLVVMIPVIDRRYGDVFDPPVTHLGRPLKGSSPMMAANLAVVYFENLIEDAWRLV
ncbi:MAG: hypothetical protein ACXW3D_02430 [Caulobacteraceae bacterium]